MKCFYDTINKHIIITNVENTKKYRALAKLFLPTPLAVDQPPTSHAVPASLSEHNSNGRPTPDIDEEDEELVETIAEITDKQRTPAKKKDKSRKKGLFGREKKFTDSKDVEEKFLEMLD